MKEITNWKRGNDGSYLFECPKCYKKLAITPRGNHKVDSNLVVSPSVIHECGFHDYIKFLT